MHILVFPVKLEDLPQTFFWSFLFRVQTPNFWVTVVRYFALQKFRKVSLSSQCAPRYNATKSKKSGGVSQIWGKEKQKRTQAQRTWAPEKLRSGT